MNIFDRYIICSNILFKSILAKRVKCKILYASETGRSQEFAVKLDKIFRCAFRTNLISMSEYGGQNLEEEILCLFVTSTFGNGEAPENGKVYNILNFFSESICIKHIFFSSIVGI